MYHTEKGQTFPGVVEKISHSPRAHDHGKKACQGQRAKRTRERALKVGPSVVVVRLLSLNDALAAGSRYPPERTLVYGSHHIIHIQGTKWRVKGHLPGRNRSEFISPYLIVIFALFFSRPFSSCSLYPASAMECGNSLSHPSLFPHQERSSGARMHAQTTETHPRQSLNALALDQGFPTIDWEDVLNRLTCLSMRQWQPLHCCGEDEMYARLVLIGFARKSLRSRRHATHCSLAVAGGNE